MTVLIAQWSGLRLVSAPSPDHLALAWAALNMATSYREALLLLAEDMQTEPETIAAAQRYIIGIRGGQA